MHAGFLGGGDDRIRLRFGSKRQMFCATVRRTIRRLRQIADVAAEHIGRPLVERRAVEPHLAAAGIQTADQRANQRSFCPNRSDR